MKSRALSFFSYFGILVLIAVELLKYSGVVGNYLFFDLWHYVLAFLLLIGIGRLITRQQMDQQLIKLNNRVVLPAAIVSVVLTFGLESYTYTNFVFSTFGINHLALLDLLVFSFGFLIITAPIKLLKKHWATLLFFSFLLGCLFLHTYFFEYFFHLSSNLTLESDGNFMEWLQVWILGGGVVLAVILSYQEKNRLRKFFYVLLALFFIVLIGEEISWGGQWFDIPIKPDPSNYQKEFNLHNQPIINEAVMLLYIFAFLYAFISWRVRKIAEKKKKISTKVQAWWDIFCFRGAEVLYFIPTFIFNPYAAYTIVPGYPPILDFFHGLGVTPEFGKMLNFLAQWRESFEVLFYAGIVLHFFNIFLKNNCKLKPSRAN